MTHRVQPRHAAPTVSVPQRLMRRLHAHRRGFVALGAASLTIAALLSMSSTAGAASSHDPIGYLDQVGAAGKTAITVSGWAGDQDAPTSPATVLVLIDNQARQYLVTSINRPDVAAARGVGPKVGFRTTLSVAAGNHTVCVDVRNVGPGSSVTIGCQTVAVGVPSAAEIAAHSPVGMVDGVGVSANTVSVHGWSYDPDSVSQPLTITATVDGTAARLTSVSVVARPDVAAVKHVGSRQGFSFTTVIATNAVHTLCVTATNISIGADKQLGCSTFRIGPPPPTAAQIAAESPSGSLEAAAAGSATSLQVRGWATDPDNRNYPVSVVAYVDGAAHTPVAANLPRPDLSSNKLAGPNSGFSYSLMVGSGSHNVCLWAVNIGIGVNKLIGCKSLSTPAISMPAGPTPATPAVNTKIAASAAGFIGSKYVWGGEDPKVGFDCSGLVQYTYRLAGVSTPRVAQDQFTAARMIAPGRAVPGDLVFFHDTEGYVYHVGIYAKPGLMYAAVDEAEGVRYQTIWDPTATYGSFTHS